MGRRLPWWICKGFNEMQNALRVASSERLQEMLAILPRSERSVLMDELNKLRVALIEWYAAKNDYLFHAPYKAIGAYFCTQGGDVAQARRLLAETLAEVDRAAAAGNEHKLHRVARRLFLSGTRTRADADWFIAEADASLNDVPRLFVALQEYALVSIVERKIEAVHATIKRCGSYKFGISLAQLCACIREKRNFDLLKANTAFHAYCVQVWRQRSLVDQVLVLRATAAELKRMSFKQKVHLVYQSSLQTEYGSILPARDAHAGFLAVTADTRSQPTRMSATLQACVGFFRDAFERDCFFRAQGHLRSIEGWDLRQCVGGLS